MNKNSTDNTGKSGRVVRYSPGHVWLSLYFDGLFKFFHLNVFTTRVYLPHRGRQEQFNIYRACVRLEFDNKVETNIIKLLEICVLHTNDVKLPTLFAQSLMQLLSEKIFSCMTAWWTTWSLRTSVYLDRGGGDGGWGGVVLIHIYLRWNFPVRHRNPVSASVFQFRIQPPHQENFWQLLFVSHMINVVSAHRFFLSLKRGGTGLKCELTVVFFCFLWYGHYGSHMHTPYDTFLCHILTCLL